MGYMPIFLKNIVWDVVGFTGNGDEGLRMWDRGLITYNNNNNEKKKKKTKKKKKKKKRKNKERTKNKEKVGIPRNS